MRINHNNFKKRQLDRPLPYFTVTRLRKPANVQQIALWITENCYGRFSITEAHIWENYGSTAVYEIGFEQKSDVTLWALSSPFVTQNVN